MTWQTDDTLYPPGWNFSITPKLSFYRSPEGTVFKGARMALKHMIENVGFSNQDILNMKKAMSLNGWIEHASLPENWLYRRKNRAIQFCDSEANFYTSKEVAMKKLNENGVHQESDSILRLKQFQAPANTVLKSERRQESAIPKRTRKTVIPDASWLSDTSLYPEGWKYRMCKNSTDFEKRTIIQFQLPNGTVLKGLRLALAYMIKNSYSLENISIMKKALGQRGWKEHASLPRNWMFRRIDRLQFCDSFGNFFASREKAIKFSLELNSLSEEDIHMVKNFQPK